MLGSPKKPANVRIHRRMHLRKRIHIYIYIHIHIHIYKYIYIHKDKNTYIYMYMYVDNYNITIMQTHLHATYTTGTDRCGPKLQDHSVAVHAIRPTGLLGVWASAM